jgi:hypothetical protein
MKMNRRTSSQQATHRQFQGPPEPSWFQVASALAEVLDVSIPVNKSAYEAKKAAMLLFETKNKDYQNKAEG